MLMISGLQHYYYCHRQWMLIHIEQQWADNYFTKKGEILHERVDDPFIQEARGDKFISRSMPLVSYELGFYGLSDAVEFVKDMVGCLIPGHSGLFRPIPVEYKAGKPKEDDCDAVQLCAQGMCLEEMLSIHIPEGFLYYGKTRHRLRVAFSDRLRGEVVRICRELHDLARNDVKIPPEYSEKCDRCSLEEICVPKAKVKYKSVRCFIDHMLAEEGDSDEKAP